MPFDELMKTPFMPCRSGVASTRPLPRIWCVRNPGLSRNILIRKVSILKKYGKINTKKNLRILIQCRQNINGTKRARVSLYCIELLAHDGVVGDLSIL